MPEATFALTTITTSRLEALLRLVHRGELACPVTPLALTCVGFQDASEVIMSAIRRLDAVGVRAVLVCVLAERRQT